MYFCGMNKEEEEERIRYLEQQLKLFRERERALLEQIGLLSAQVVQLNQKHNLLTIKKVELTQTIASLQEALL